MDSQSVSNRWPAAWRSRNVSQSLLRMGATNRGGNSGHGSPRSFAITRAGLPVAAFSGKVLGSFAMYYPEPRDAPPRALDLTAVLARTAATVISRHQTVHVTRKLRRRLMEGQSGHTADIAEGPSLTHFGQWLSPTMFWMPPAPLLACYSLAVPMQRSNG